MSISDKAKADLTYYWSKLKDNSFDQDTIKNLYISARESMPPKSFIREIGDFVAHNERNRGKTYKTHRLLEIAQTGKTISLRIPIGVDIRLLQPELIELFKHCFAESAVSTENTIQSVFNDIAVATFVVLHGMQLNYDGLIVTLRIFDCNTLIHNPAPTLQMMCCNRHVKSVAFISDIPVYDYIDCLLLHKLDEVPNIRALRQEDGLLKIVEVCA